MNKAKVNLFYIPCSLIAIVGLSGCSGSTYFIHGKSKQRYTTADIAANIFDDDDDDIRYGSSGTQPYSAYSEIGRFSGAGIRREAFRDSNVLGTLYYDPDGEGRGEKPYSFTVRKDHRAYNVETALTEPITIGEHKMSTNLSIGRHRDHDFTAGLRFRIPF